MMDFVFQAEGFREVRGLQHGGKAALVWDITTQVVGGFFGEPDRIGIEAAGREFGSDDGDVEFLAQLDIVVDVLVGERVFIPVETELLDRAADAQRVGVAVAPGGVEHQEEIVANRLAYGDADLDVFVRVAWWVDLVGTPTIGLEFLRLVNIGGDIGQDLRTGVAHNGGAIGPHQGVHGQVSDLASEVPQRDVDGADGAVADDATDQAHVGMDTFAVQWVLAQEEGLERAEELGAVHRGGVGGRAEEGVALQAGIGADAEQAEIGFGGG